MREKIIIANRFISSINTNNNEIENNIEMNIDFRVMIGLVA